MKEQRRAIIVGATSGIGLEVAKVLAGKGWLVGIAGRRQELLQPSGLVIFSNKTNRLN